MEISEQNNIFWKKLCERVNDLIEEGNIREEYLHNFFESQLKNTLKWPPNHLKHEITVQMGRETKRADTIMEGDGFGIIIEMKTPIAVLGENDREQLISYMTAYHTARNDIRCKYGLLIGKEIEVYFRSEPDKKPQLVARFGFDVNSSDGNSLGKILMYDECSEEKLDKFMNEPHDIKQPPRPPKPPKMGNNEGNKGYDEETTAALEEIQEIAQFFSNSDNGGYEMNPRDKPWGNQIYAGYRIIGNSTRGVSFVISIFLHKTPDERYQFKYETAHSGYYEFEEKQRRIFDRFHISEFRRGRNRENDVGKIIFRINDPRNEILDIIAKTREIMGF
jgi:hypothetical protein